MSKVTGFCDAGGRFEVYTKKEVDAKLSDVSNEDKTKLPLTGGTMTGQLIAQTNTAYTTRQVRNVIISTASPSGGSNGDIWLKYT